MDDQIGFRREDAERLVRVEQILIGTNDKLAAYVAKTEKLEERQDKTDKKVNWILGVGAALTFVVGLVARFFHG